MRFRYNMFNTEFRKYSWPAIAKNKFEYYMGIKITSSCSFILLLAQSPLLLK